MTASSVSTYYTANVIVSVILSLIFRTSGGGASPQWLRYFMSLIVRPAFFVLNAYLIGRFSIRKFDRIPVPVPVLFSVMNIFITATVIFFDYSGSFSGGEGLSIAINAVIYVFMTVWYSFMYLICLHCSNEIGYAREIQKMTAQNEAIRIEEESIDAMRRVRHDMRNRYTYMDMLIKEGRYGDLGTYLDGMKESLDEGFLYVDTGNRELDTILNMEQGKAERAGCMLGCEVSVPGMLGIDETDLSILLINMIDNAIESNVRYGLTEAVKVGIRMNNDILCIHVENRLPDGIDMGPILSMVSSKRDGKNHGIGHRTIKKICGKYGGACDFTVKDGMFFADAVVQPGGVA